MGTAHTQFLCPPQGDQSVTDCDQPPERTIHLQAHPLCFGQRETVSQQDVNLLPQIFPTGTHPSTQAKPCTLPGPLRH